MIPDRDHDDSYTGIISSDPSMSSFQLSTGCCAHLPLSSCVNEANWKEEYVVQFLSVKKVVRGKSERYRLIISDGIYFIQGMLATHCNALVKAENIQDYTVAVIERWTSNIVQNRRCVPPVFDCRWKLLLYRLVILLSIRILGNPDEKIGIPTALDDASSIVLEHTPVATSLSGETSTGVQQRQNSPLFDGQRKYEENVRSLPIIPIEELNPYRVNWTIKARVVQKSDIKNWSKETSDGKLFSVVFLDQSGKIVATAFNTVADELFSRLEKGKVYQVSKARVKVANKAYSNHGYELILERTTHIEEVVFF